MHIVKSLGGAVKVAQIAGVHPSRVWGWMKEKERGGTGGTIPYRHIGKLMRAAQEQGVELSATDFVPATP